MDKINESVLNANIELVEKNKYLDKEIKQLKKKINEAINYIYDKSIEYKPHYRKIDLNTKDCTELLDILESEFYEW